MGVTMGDWCLPSVGGQQQGTTGGWSPPAASQIQRGAVEANSPKRFKVSCAIPQDTQ